jgi:smad nuclear-interacting protein 1
MTGYTMDSFRWGKKEDNDEESNEPPVIVEKPNFGLSGALAKDKATGNVQNGVVMKWSEPAEARVPQRRFRLYVFKSDQHAGAIHLVFLCL